MTIKTTFVWIRYFLKHTYKYNIYLVWLFLNRKARAHWSKNPLQLKPGMTSLVEDLKRDGVCSIQFTELLPAETLAQITSAAVEATSDPSIRAQILEAEESVPTADTETRGKLYQLELWDRLDSDLKRTLVRLALTEEFLAIASSYMGLSCSLSRVDIWYNVPFSGTDILCQQWHRDAGDRKIVKIFLYLCDVDKTTGPFCYIPRSHIWGGMYDKKFPRWRPMSGDIVESRVSQDRKLVCTGKSGTLVFADTSGLHRGGHALSKHRLIFYAMYTTAVGKPGRTVFKYENYLSQAGSCVSPSQEFALTPWK